jgi:hypothetical protein
LCGFGSSGCAATRKWDSTETELLLELLEPECQELQPEIHRTQTSRLRDILQSRLRIVELLSERLEALTEKSVKKQ